MCCELVSNFSKNNFIFFKEQNLCTVTLSSASETGGSIPPDANGIVCCDERLTAPIHEDTRDERFSKGTSIHVDLSGPDDDKNRVHCSCTDIVRG